MAVFFSRLVAGKKPPKTVREVTELSLEKQFAYIEILGSPRCPLKSVMVTRFQAGFGFTEKHKKRNAAGGGFTFWVQTLFYFLSPQHRL